MNYLSKPIPPPLQEKEKGTKKTKYLNMIVKGYRNLSRKVKSH